MGTNILPAQDVYLTAFDHIILPLEMSESKSVKYNSCTVAQSHSHSFFSVLHPLHREDVLSHSYIFVSDSRGSPASTERY